MRAAGARRQLPPVAAPGFSRVVGGGAAVQKSVAERAAVLRKIAELMEEKQTTLLYLAIKEAGKTLVTTLFSEGL